MGGAQRYPSSLHARRKTMGFARAQPILPHLASSARRAKILEADQADLPCPDHFAKIFLFAPDPNHLYIHRHPVPTRGALRGRHERWERDAMDAAASGARIARGRMMLRRTAKSCGPDAPTLVSSWRDFPLNDGGKKARSPGRARRKPLKPLRREGRVESGEPVVTTRVLSTFAHEAAGALGTRLSLRPLSCEAKDRAQLGRIAPRERGVVCVSLKI
jgi:hypothetical protein